MLLDTHRGNARIAVTDISVRLAFVLASEATREELWWRSN